MNALIISLNAAALVFNVTLALEGHASPINYVAIGANFMALAYGISKALED